jgi:nucleoside-diphosphate-sugar epimerase
MATRVLVTGATGCIGRHCLPLLLERGWEVHAVSSRPQASPLPNVTWHEADLFDPTRMASVVASAQATHLLHLAWYVVPGKSGSSLTNIHWLQASLALLQQFRACGGERVVVAGSSFEYDWRYGYCSEQLTPANPNTLYGACKEALRSVLEEFARETGLSQAWPRIFFLYGPHEHPERLIPAVVRALLRGEIARCSHGDQIRDYLYVGDVADALVTILASDVQGPINIGSGRALTLRDLVTRAAEKLNGLDRVHFGAIPSRPNDAPLVVADIARLRTQLGWKPSFDLDRGLEATIAWWRSHQGKEIERA